MRVVSRIWIWFCLLIQFCIASQVYAQQKNRLQLNGGISNTIHYNYKPATKLYNCTEACYVEIQRPYYSFNYGLSYFRTINAKHDIQVGLGIAEHRFEEEGMADSGGGTLYPFEHIVTIYYYDFYLAHRLNIFLKPRKSKNEKCPDSKEKESTIKTHFFWENNLIYELITQEDYTLKTHNVALKSEVGVHTKFFKGLYGEVSGFYKTGIMKYNKVKYNKNYVPYGYGVEIGVGCYF